MPDRESQLKNALSWALDLLDMYDGRMVQLGDPPEMVYDATQRAGKARARAILAGHPVPPVVEAFFRAYEHDADEALRADLDARVLAEFDERGAGRNPPSGRCADCGKPLSWSHTDIGEPDTCECPHNAGTPASSGERR